MAMDQDRYVATTVEYMTILCRVVAYYHIPHLQVVITTLMLA